MLEICDLDRFFEWRYLILDEVVGSKFSSSWSKLGVVVGVVWVLVLDILLPHISR
jgi:hypothetical protein